MEDKAVQKSLEQLEDSLEKGKGKKRSTDSSTGSGLQTFVDKEKIINDVKIDESDLDVELTQHASLYVSYGINTVSARRQYERLKNAFEILEATLNTEYRSSLAEGGAKVTEAAISSAITIDRRWAAAQAKVIEAHSIWKLCEIAERAFEQRKDLLLEVARNQRREREGALRVVAQDEITTRAKALRTS